MWPVVKLGDHVLFITGFPFKSSQYVDDSTGIRLLRGDNVGQGFLRWSGVKKWPTTNVAGLDKYWLQQGDIIIAMDRPWIDAGLKYACVTNRDLPCLLVQRVARLRGNGITLTTDYLRYIISDPSFTDYIKPIVTGINIPHISGAQIQAHQFKLPPLDTQHKIAAVLSAYDDLIENNQRRIAILEELARNLYREWFVDFRFPGHEQAAFRETELGRVPEGWKSTKIDKVATVHRGRSYKSSELASEGGLPFLNLKCINRGGGFRRDGIKRYIGSYKPSQVARTGDIIMAVTDMTQERRIVAHPARVPDIGEELSVISMDLVRIESMPAVPSSYLYALFMFSDFSQSYHSALHSMRVSGILHGSYG